jgi:hypothetical protein
MKTFQVIFKKRVSRKKSVFVEAATHRMNGSRLEFLDQSGAVAQHFDAFKVNKICVFSDDEGTEFYVAS